MNSLFSSQGWLFNSTGGGLVLLFIVFWSLVWKAIALWKAARRTDTAWFVIMTILNTAGILDIIYIFAVARDQKKK
jgi:methionyl-tRNA synthetase